jgi:hypothetical protein
VRRLRPAFRAALAALLLLSGCDGGEEATEGGPPPERVAALAGVPLRPEEVPQGLRPEEDRSGPIRSLREVLPSREAVPNRPPVPGGLTGAFRDGYQAVYTADSGGLGSPPQGITSAASTAVRFTYGSAAGRFLEYLREVQTGAGQTAEREELPAEGLGEAGFGWRHKVPFAESFGYVWRSGDVVISLTMDGAVGATDAEEVLALAARIDARTA